MGNIILDLTSLSAEKSCEIDKPSTHYTRSSCASLSGLTALEFLSTPLRLTAPSGQRLVSNAETTIWRPKGANILSWTH